MYILVIVITTGYLFQTLYKTQVSELKEELEDRNKFVLELEEERTSLAQQVQIALARADSEALARSIAEETVTDLEKEKTIKELEMKDIIGKHRADLSSKEASVNSVSVILFNCLFKVISCRNNRIFSR